MSSHAVASNPFLEDFAAHAAELPGAGLPWLDARRAEAIKLVRVRGLPHRRTEDWKYSDLRNALKEPLEGDALWEIEGIPEGIEVFDLSGEGNKTPKWVVEYLGTVLPIRGTMDAASFALARSVIAIRIPVGRHIESPIRLNHKAFGHSRVLLVLEDNSGATLIERDQGYSSDSRNVGFEIVLKRGAQLNHTRFEQSDSATRVSVGELSVRVEAGSKYFGNYFGWGSKLSRTEIGIALTGLGAEAHLVGVGLPVTERHFDITTHIDHAAPGTTSTQKFRFIAGTLARAVYQGKITVREGSDGSDSLQNAKAMLLSAQAEIDLKPELEIFADDVKCAHGAAVGDLDTDSLFYLRSRGIPEAEARVLLIRAFLAEVVEGIADETIRATAWQFVEDGLARAMELTP